MSIPANQALPLFTEAIVAKYNEMKAIEVKPFLRSFFSDKATGARYPAIEVSRGSEKVAIDVPRGHQGNMNISTKYTQKVFDPFYFNEYFEATKLDAYFRVFGSGSFNMNDMTDYVNSVSDEQLYNKRKIERAYERMCGEVLDTGVITSLTDGATLIDFDRKSESLVDLGSGDYWNEASTNPFTDMEAGGNFLRKVGKSQGFILNVIMGTEAYAAFITNDVYKERAKYFQYQTDMIAPVTLNSLGAAYHGEIDVNSFRARIWTYNEYYEDANGDLQPFLDPKKVVMLPEKTNFNMIYAAVPKLMLPGNYLALQSAPFDFYDVLDLKQFSHEFHVQSSGIPVPVAVDQIYTMRVLAAS